MIRSANDFQREWDNAADENQGKISTYSQLIKDSLEYFRKAHQALDDEDHPVAAAFMEAGETLFLRAKQLHDENPSIRLEVFQQDWIPGFAAFNDDGSIKNDTAHIAINVGALMAGVQVNDFAKADIPYIVAESLMHEFIHALEAWAQVEFSDDKIEALLNKYREMAKDLPPPSPEDLEPDTGLQPGATVEGVGVVLDNPNHAPWPLDLTGNMFFGCVYVRPTSPPEATAKLCDVITGKVLTTAETLMRINNREYDLFNRAKNTGLTDWAPE